MPTLAILLCLLVQATPEYDISGTVIDGISGQPLNKTRVFLELLPRGPAVPPIVTSSDGVFRFTGLRTGKYRLSAERIGLPRQSFRQHALYQMHSTAIVVGDGERTEGLVFPMIPGGVIAGIVADPRGEPVAGMTVDALRVVGNGKQRYVAQRFTQTTNDQGRYRIPFLPKGNFAVVISGRPSQNQELAALDPIAYPVTFHPGTTDAGHTALINVQPGQESRADVVLSTTAAARLIAQAPDAGPNARRYVYVTAEALFGWKVAVAPPRWLTGNTVRFEQLPEGRYTLNLVQEGTRRGGWSTIDVTAPETHAVVGDTPPTEVSIHITVEGMPLNPDQPMTVSLQSLTTSAPFAQVVRPDGTAFLAAVPADRYVPVVYQGGTLAVTSIRARGAQQSGLSIMLPPTGKVELDLTVDAAARNLRGHVVRGGVPFAGALVMLVQKSSWESVGGFRYDQSDSDGSFNWPSLPKGDYWMFAFEDGEPLDYDDPEIIRRLIPIAQELTVDGTSGAEVTVRLSQPAK